MPLVRRGLALTGRPTSASGQAADVLHCRALLADLDGVVRALIRGAAERHEMSAFLDAVARATDERRYADASVHLAQLHYLALTEGRG